MGSKRRNRIGETESSKKMPFDLLIEISDEFVKTSQWHSVILSKAKNLIKSIYFRSFTTFRMTNQDFLRDHHFWAFSEIYKYNLTK